MTVSRLLGRTEAFKVKPVFLGEGVRIKVGVIGEGEVEPRDKTERLYIKSQNHVPTSHVNFF